MKDDRPKGRDSRIKDIFLRAVDLPAGADQAALLKEACGEDEKLHREVESLLASRADADTVLDRDFLAEALALPSSLIGETIGPYRVLEQIGEGGFGVVFRVEQTQPFRRQLALKLLKPCLDSAENIARFESERQALALLGHPNILKVIDAGSTEDGLPFFVMELANGPSLVTHCRERPVSLAERLGLFRSVCAAVHHAHLNGIVHRDLKPANIVVVSQDGEPTPKVIDFGIAKATRDPLIDKPAHTAQQAFLGTPAYSSPERLEGRADGADPRTDIYSLGALLYELLSGQLPKAPSSGAGSESVPISDRFASLPESERFTVSKSLGLPPSRIQSLLKGELGAIAMKCLERDPERRYPTVAALLADFDAHLQGKPVTAMRRGPLHRASKLWQCLGKPRALWIEAAALVVICSAVFLRAYGPLGSEDPTAYPVSALDKSVAILPLQDLGPHPERAYFTEGIHMDLINRVSKIEELRTISRLAVLPYRGTDLTLAQIADDLDVATILEGTVQLAGNQLRVNVQLIDASRNHSLWAEQYNQELTTENLFRIQNDITQSVAQALRAILTPEESRGLQESPSYDMAALEMYFKAKTLWEQSMEGETRDFENTVPLLQSAILADPTYPNSYALLGSILLAQAWYAGASTEKTVQQAQPLIEKALQLDPDLSDAHLALGYLRTRQRDDERAALSYRKALELDPSNHRALSWYANFLIFKERKPQEGLEYYRKAMKVMPNVASAQAQYASTLLRLGKLGEAEVIYQELYQTHSDNVDVIKGLAKIAEARHRFDWKARWLRQVYALEPESHLNALHVSWAYRNLLDEENSAIWAQRFLDLTADSENLGIQIFRLVMEEQWDEADQLFWNTNSLDRDFYMNCSIYYMAERDLRQGNARQALRRYLKGQPELNDQRLDRGELHPSLSFRFAKALVAVGEVARGTRVVQNVIKRLQDPFSPNNQYTTSTLLHAHLVLDNNDAAQQIARGNPFLFVQQWRDDEELHSLFEDPEMVQLMLDTEAILAEQKARLTQWQAEGKLAAMPPLPGTPPQLADASDVEPILIR